MSKSKQILGEPNIAKKVFRGSFMGHNSAIDNKADGSKGHSWKQRYEQWVEMEHRLMIACADKAQQKEIIRILTQQIN